MAAWLRGCNVPTGIAHWETTFSPNLTADELEIAKIEGWILGVV
jgi:hypothetical protein